MHVLIKYILVWCPSFLGWQRSNAWYILMYPKMFSIININLKLAKWVALMVIWCKRFSKLSTKELIAILPKAKHMKHWKNWANVVHFSPSILIHYPNVQDDRSIEVILHNICKGTLDLSNVIPLKVAREDWPSECVKLGAVKVKT